MRSPGCTSRRPEFVLSQIAETVAAALARRDGSPTRRVFDSAADGVPGLIIERFGDGVAPPVFRLRGAPGLVEVGAAAAEALPGTTFGRFGHENTFGPEDGDRIVVEAGLRYAVRLAGQRNTGLFLDGRPARAWVRAHSAGRRVLNLFAYTCAFGVAAAAGGARSTVNVDTARGALDRGRENYALNDLPVDGRTFWRSDAREALRRMRRSGARFDGVILDPPPEAHGKGRRRLDPIREWPKLVQGCVDLLSPEGWLLALRTDLDPALPGASVWVGGAGKDFPSQRLRASAAAVHHPGDVVLP